MNISDRHRLSATILLMSCLWSCTSISGASKSRPAAKPDAGERRTYVFNSATCLVPRGRITGDTAQESPVALLVGAIAPKLIDLAVDSAASALQRAAAAKTETISATNGSYFHFYQRGTNAEKGTVKMLGNCVTVVLLDSARDWGPFTAAGAKADISAATIADVRTALQMNDKGLKGGPVFYYEATVVASEDNTAFQLRPAFLYYPESLGTGKVGDERALNLVYTYRDLSGTAVATSTVSLPAIRVGSVRSAAENRHFQAPWLPALPLSEVAKTTVSEQDSIEKPDFDLENPMTPFNLDASVSETRNAREWLKGIADALGSAEVKTAATTALKQTLIPAEGKAAETTAAVSALTAERDLALSVRDVEIACVDRSATAAGSAERAKADRTVVEKQYAANETATKAGAKRPYPKPNAPSCSP